jgi:hypothetical protein
MKYASARDIMVSDIYIYMGLNEGIALGKKCK